MKGTDHMCISLSWGILIISPLILTLPPYYFAFLIGITIGSILPDVDANISPYEHKSNIMRVFGIAIKKAYKATVWIFNSVNTNYNRELDTHRGILHSLPGILLCISIIIIPINIIVYFLGFWGPAVLLVSGGIYVGAFFHLLEDCCTWTGVRILAPFKNVLLHGKINTSAIRGEENRPHTYGKVFALMGAVCACFFALRNSPIFDSVAFIYDLSPFVLIGITTIISLLTWYIMFRYSGGEIKANSY